MSIQALLSGTPDTLSGERVEKFYGRGWLLTHYLTVEPSRRGQLTAYLAALRDGKPAAQANAVLGDPKALSRSLAAYLRSKTFSVFSVPAARLPIDPVTVRPLTRGEAASMAARIQSQRGVDSRSARDVQAMARKAAAAFPGDAAVETELAEAEYDAGDAAASRAAADRALAADPQSIRAMMYAGLSREALALKASPRDPAAFEKARAWIRRANLADKENPWPLQQYYFSYLAAGATPTRNAEEALLYARELAPFDPALAIRAGYIELLRDHPDKARRALQTVAYSAHSGEMGKQIAEVLDHLGEGSAAAAARLKTMLDKPEKE